MSTSVYLNKTEKITVTFYSWTSDTGTNQPEDATSVAIKIFNTDTVPDTLLDTDSATYTGSTGKYYYEWTPTSLGNFNVQFYATFSDGSVNVANNFFTVYEATTAPTGATLQTDQVIQFVGGLTPLYLDPEEVEAIYPDANKAEIVELIHNLSVEVKGIERLSDDELPSYVALEYIQAATACALSKRYDDMTAGIDFSFRLGDLQVDNRPTFKQTLNRGNATTWCELAFVLRKEMLAAKVGIKTLYKGRGGGDMPGLIPERKLRYFEKDTFQTDNLLG